MNSALHIWHAWMNRRNEERAKAGEEFDHSIYRWKDALNFAEYGHKRIQQAFEGTLPTTHKHCSLSPTEKVENNKLVCCLGQEVPTCPMLLSIKTLHEEYWTRPVVECSGYDPGEYYRKEVKPENMYRTMAKTCAWHVYEESRKRFIDSSEGFHLDEGDRRFWQRTYESMATPELDQTEVR